MKRTIKVLTAVLMASTFVAAPALAGSPDKKVHTGAAVGAKANTGLKMKGAGQKAGAGAKVGVDMKASGGMKARGLDTAAGTAAGVKSRGLDTARDVTSKATGGINANNQGEVVSSIRSNGNAAADIGAMSDVSNVTVVRVDSASDASATAIDNAVRDNQEAIDQLRTSIEANGELASKLNAEGVLTENVVSARTQADGSLTVYIR